MNDARSSELFPELDYSNVCCGDTTVFFLDLVAIILDIHVDIFVKCLSLT